MVQIYLNIINIMSKQSWQDNLSDKERPNDDPVGKTGQLESWEPSYEYSICHLFQSIQGKFKNQPIQVIRSLLFYCWHIWQEVSTLTHDSAWLPSQTMGCVAQAFLKKVHKLYPQEEQLDYQDGDLCQSQLDAVADLQDLANPFQMVEELGSGLKPNLLEAAAELITLAMTKTQFQGLDHKALAAGSIAAIKQLKNIETQYPHNQDEQAKTLYLDLLGKLDEIISYQ